VIMRRLNTERLQTTVWHVLLSGYIFVASAPTIIDLLERWTFGPLGILH
jgi:hypothetical protein